MVLWTLANHIAQLIDFPRAHKQNCDALWQSEMLGAQLLWTGALSRKLSEEEGHFNRSISVSASLQLPPCRKWIWFI